MNKYLAIYGKPRYLGLVEYDGEIKKGSTLIVESVRGEELAVAVGEINAEQEAAYRLLRNASEHGDGMAKNSEPVVTDLTFMAFASDDDIETAESYRAEEDRILKEAKELLTPHNLEMKLIDVEFLRAKRKLFFYFSSEQRVDFRAYVRDLAREFKTRIELRQVGVRDEAKIIRGVGPCGQPCCCSYWLNQFAPICIKMVKEQNLALNPAKISGICGRLMCCMCYEHEAYHEAWEGFPNPGTKIKTPNGNVIVAGIDLPTKSLRCFIVGKGEVKIPKDKFAEFKEVVTSGGEWVVPEEEIEEPDLKIQDIFPKCMQCAGHHERAASEQKREENAGKRRSEDGETNAEQRPRGNKKRKKHHPKHENQAAGEGQEGIREETPQKVKNAADNRPPKEEKAAPGGEERPKRHFQRRRRPNAKKGGDNAAAAKAEV